MRLARQIEACRVALACKAGKTLAGLRARHQGLSYSCPSDAEPDGRRPDAPRVRAHQGGDLFLRSASEVAVDASGTLTGPTRRPPTRSAGENGGGESDSTPTTTPSENGEAEWCAQNKPSKATGVAAPEANDTFGAAKVMAAYCMLAQMQIDYSFDDTLWRQSDGFTKQDFAPVRAFLTPLALNTGTGRRLKSHRGRRLQVRPPPLTV